MKTIEIVTIPVSDQQKAKEFYMKLGFHIIVEAPMGDGTNWVQLGLPNQPTSISLLNHHGVMFETDDIEKEIGELQAKGIEISKIETTPWGKFAQMKDLDGNGLSFHQK
jgi:catechol 2,3-dioxygenase-like lactoylglutathione lyase family enzyme